MSNVKNAVEYALDGKLSDMTASLEAAIREKVLGAIEAKKVEVAQTMFNPVAESVESEEESEEDDIEAEDLDLDEEQLDEISKSILGSYAKKAAKSATVQSGLASKSSQHGEFDKMQKHLATRKKREAGYEKAIGKLTAEDIEQVDEKSITDNSRRPTSLVTPRPDNSRRPTSTDQKLHKFTGQSKNGSISKIPTNSHFEDIEQVDEVLDASMGAEKYIHDFVHSKNPKFAGKSKKERIQMALGAYYAAKRGK